MHASFPAHGSSTSKTDRQSIRLPSRNSLCGTSLQPPGPGLPEEGVHRRVVEPPPSPICLPRLRWICILSRKEAPVGRGLTFVSGDVETRIRPITGRPSLLPTSQARISISSPYGSPALAGKDTGLPRSASEVCAGLGTCCRLESPVDHEVAPLNPPTRLPAFWLKLVSHFSLLRRDGRCAGSHVFTIPAT